jgi:hypothetical protein
LIKIRYVLKVWVRLTEFDISNHAEEDIVALYIAMDDAMAVKVLKALGRLS